MIVDVYRKGISFNLYEQEDLDFEISLNVPSYAPLGSRIELKIHNGITSYTLETETSNLRQFAEILLSLIKERGLPEDFKDDKLADIIED